MNKLLDKNLTVIFDSNTYKGKLVLAYAKSIDSVVIEQDINTVNFSSSYLLIIIEKLGVHPKKLINKSHPFYQNTLKNHDFDERDWLHILQHNMSLLKAPIVIKDDHVIMCNTPTEIYQLAS